MKKLLALVLTLCMLLSLLGGMSALADGEKTVLTFGSVYDGNDWQYYKPFADMLEQLNIEVQFTYYDSNSFAAMLAGGDLPDIVVAKNIISNVLDNDLAMDISPYLEEYAPNLTKGTAGYAFQLSKQLMTTPEGGLYIIPPCIGIHNPNPGCASDQVQYGYMVRWDYYKELGCPEIHNEDDYINVLLQMHNNHPTTEDGSPTYLYGLRSSNIGYRTSFLKECAVNYWANYQFKNDIFTNEVYNGYLNMEKGPYWYEMAFLNKIYRIDPSLIDMDLFTMTSDEYKAKLEKGQYMGVYHENPTNNKFYNAERAKDPDTVKSYVVVPSDGTVYYNNINMLTGNVPSRFFFISKNSKNWKAALAFFNMLYDEDFNRYLYSGPKGVTWDYDENGVAYMFPEALADRAAGGEMWTQTAGNGFGNRIHWLTGLNPGVLHSDGQPVNLMFTREGVTAAQAPIDNDVAHWYGKEYIMDIYVGEGMRDFRNDFGENIAGTMTEIPADKLRIIEACNDVLEVGKATLLFCETDEEYAAAVKEMQDEMRALGIEEVFEWYKSVWDQKKDLFNALREDALAELGIEMYPVD